MNDPLMALSTEVSEGKVLLLTLTKSYLEVEGMLDHFAHIEKTWGYDAHLNSQWFPLFSSGDAWGSTSLLTFKERLTDIKFRQALIAHWDELILGSGYPISDSYEEDVKIIEDDDLVIWWMNGEDCRRIESYWAGCAEYTQLPMYLKTDIRSMSGRPLHGRLWADTAAPVICEVESMDLLEDDVFDSYGYDVIDNVGGIVMYRRHVAHVVAHFPGIITDFSTQLVARGKV